MKKILLMVLTVILLVFLYLATIKSFAIGNLKIESVKELKNANDNLETKFQEVNRITSQEYKDQVKKLENSIKNLKDVKEKYESKTKYSVADIDVGVVQITKYKIETLWVIIDGYANDAGLKLTMDLKQGIVEGTYDLDFASSGTYIGITDFIRDIENDEKLNFKIENFVLAPSGSTIFNPPPPAEETGEGDTSLQGQIAEKTTKTTNNVDTSNIQATFTVRDVAITLDD